MKEQFSDSTLALGWTRLLCSDTGRGKRELEVYVCSNNLLRLLTNYPSWEFNNCASIRPFSHLQKSFLWLWNHWWTYSLSWQTSSGFSMDYGTSAYIKSYIFIFFNEIIWIKNTKGNTENGKAKSTLHTAWKKERSRFFPHSSLQHYLSSMRFVDIQVSSEFSWLEIYILTWICNIINNPLLQTSCCRFLSMSGIVIS